MRMPIVVGRFDNDAQRNNEHEQQIEHQQSAAVRRGSLNHTLEMKGTAFLGGQSQQSDIQQAEAHADKYAHTVPQESKSERERREGWTSKAQEQGNPSQQNGNQVSQEQPRQQEPQAQEREGRFPHQSPEYLQRESDFAARVRGRMDAFERMGKEQFGERMGFDNQRQFDIASKSYHQTKQDLATEFKAAGTKPREGQTVVEALRERQAAGNFKPIVDPNGNQYTLRDDKLIKSDRNGKELSAMPAEEVHQWEAKANRAKAQQANQGHGIGSS
ncbi:hypothetical protein [Ensifer sp. B1-9]|uniref:hypothetical protein n=1 Tax=Ensifer sp. B1-9 TaxID=3141455 RepID=UPI003D1C1E54